MEPMGRFLQANGFEVVNIGYPSTRFCVEELVEKIRLEIEELGRLHERLEFVTHSMGGILLRSLRATGAIANLGRCVMLGPPNRGSHVVDRLGGWAPFRWLNGPAGAQLGTARDSLPNRLGRVDFELGVIAGDRSVNWILSLMLPRSNDGKVAVSHASVDGQSAFKVVHATHPFLMQNACVQANVLAFLQTGAFLRD